jgi:DNA helicase IV
MTKALSTAGKQYVAALEALSSAEKAVAVAKELLTEAVAEAGVNEVTVDGKKVALITAVRRNFLVEKLKGLVTATTFEAVTKTAVEPKAFDKAKKAGDISAEIEEAVVNPTAYTRIVVTDIAEEVSVAV